MRSFLILAFSALALVLAGCGGSDDEPATTPAAQPPASTAAPDGGAVKDIRFDPEAVDVKVGQTVTWTNQEPVNHNVVADSGASFKSRNFGEGGTYSFKAAKPGTVKYECTLHPGMEGTLTVK